MALKIQNKPAQAVSTIEVKDHGQVLKSDNETEKPTIEVPSQTLPAPGPFAEVGLEASYTHNLGDYKSARVGVSLRIPCLPEEIDEAFVLGEKWVDEKLQGMIASITG